MSRRPRQFTLAALEKFTTFLASPFLKAETLDAFSKWGYVYFGIFTGGTTLLLWTLGYLSYPLSRSHAFIQFTYKTITEKVPFFKLIPDSSISLFIAPLILYFTLLFWPTGQKLVGKAFAAFLIWLASLAIQAGEWCIEHRWGSLVLIISMVSVLSLGINREFRNASNINALNERFDHWVREAQDFIDKSPFVKQETEKYEHVRLAWNNDYSIITTLPGGYVHPAHYLNKMLDILYSEKSENTAWRDLLNSKLPDLVKLMEEARSNLRPNRTLAEEDAWGSINLLMGRLYVRIAKDARNYELLNRALVHFQDVKSSLYQSAADNGKGNVYANAFSFYLPTDSATLPSEENSKSLKLICPDASQCALNSFLAYEKAAQNSMGCSYQDKRKMNNIIDLLMRVATHYNEIVKGRTSAPIQDWLTSRETLADELEKRLERMLRCNDKEPFISTIFITAAQAYAVSAKLREHSSGKELNTSRLINSGSFLKFAYSLDSRNASDWDLSYFCFITINENDYKVFSNAFRSSFQVFSAGEVLLRRIEQKCQ